MGCNCKKTIELQDKYGIKEEETLLETGYRYLWKIIISVLFICLAIVVIPVMLVVVIYNILFGKGKPIVLPKFLGKYLK